MYSVEIQLVVKTKHRSATEKVEALFQTCGILTQHWKMEWLRTQRKQSRTS